MIGNRSETCVRFLRRIHLNQSIMQHAGLFKTQLSKENSYIGFEEGEFNALFFLRSGKAIFMAV